MQEEQYVGAQSPEEIEEQRLVTLESYSTQVQSAA